MFRSLRTFLTPKCLLPPPTTDYYETFIDTVDVREILRDIYALVYKINIMTKNTLHDSEIPEIINLLNSLKVFLKKLPPSNDSTLFNNNITVNVSYAGTKYEQAFTMKIVIEYLFDLLIQYEQSLTFNEEIISKVGELLHLLSVKNIWYLKRFYQELISYPYDKTQGNTLKYIRIILYLNCNNQFEIDFEKLNTFLKSIDDVNTENNIIQDVVDILLEIPKVYVNDFSDQIKNRHQNMSQNTELNEKQQQYDDLSIEDVNIVVKNNNSDFYSLVNELKSLQHKNEIINKLNEIFLVLPFDIPADKINNTIDIIIDVKIKNAKEEDRNVEISRLSAKILQDICNLNDKIFIHYYNFCFQSLLKIQEKYNEYNRNKTPHSSNIKENLSLQLSHKLQRIIILLFCDCGHLVDIDFAPLSDFITNLKITNTNLNYVVNGMKNMIEEQENKQKTHMKEKKRGKLKLVLNETMASQPIQRTNTNTSQDHEVFQLLQNFYSKVFEIYLTMTLPQYLNTMQEDIFIIEKLNIISKLIEPLPNDYDFYFKNIKISFYDHFENPPQREYTMLIVIDDLFDLFFNTKNNEIKILIRKIFGQICQTIISIPQRYYYHCISTLQSNILNYLEYTTNWTLFYEQTTFVSNHFLLLFEFTSPSNFKYNRLTNELLKIDEKLMNTTNENKRQITNMIVELLFSYNVGDDLNQFSEETIELLKQKRNSHPYVVSLSDQTYDENSLPIAVAVEKNKNDDYTGNVIQAIPIPRGRGGRKKSKKKLKNKGYAKYYNSRKTGKKLLSKKNNIMK